MIVLQKISSQKYENKPQSVQSRQNDLKTLYNAFWYFLPKIIEVDNQLGDAMWDLTVRLGDAIVKHNVDST